MTTRRPDPPIEVPWDDEDEEGSSCSVGENSQQRISPFTYTAKHLDTTMVEPRALFPPEEESFLFDEFLHHHVVDNEQWRRYGRARRRHLLQADRLQGGTQFALNRRTGIEQYFAVANRVSSLVF